MDNAKQLTVKRVPIDSVHPDPANVRLHDERSLEAIKGSLARFRQQKPIVVDRTGTIRAGNGTYAAARALGWTEIDVVETELEGVEAVSYSLADNRTSDLSTFDEPALARILQELQAEDAMDGVGYTEEELAELVAGIVNDVPEVVEDEVPGLPDEATTRRGDVWVSRRTPEQIIADHEAEIARVRARQAAREAKARPEAKTLIAAVRAVEKAGRAAADAGNGELVKTLDAARATLAPAIVGLGLRIPEKARRGRRKKGEAA